MNTEGIHMYAKAYINEHYYKGDTTMLDNIVKNHKDSI